MASISLSLITCCCPVPRGLLQRNAKPPRQTYKPPQQRTYVRHPPETVELSRNLKKLAQPNKFKITTKYYYPGSGGRAWVNSLAGHSHPSRLKNALVSFFSFFRLPARSSSLGSAFAAQAAPRAGRCSETRLRQAVHADETNGKVQAAAVSEGNQQADFIVRSSARFPSVFFFRPLSPGGCIHGRAFFFLLLLAASLAPSVFFFFFFFYFVDSLYVRDAFGDRAGRGWSNWLLQRGQT
jgi:hypothetical protein